MFFYLWLIIYFICSFKVFCFLLKIEDNSFIIFSKVLNLFLLLGVFSLIVANRTGPDIINYQTAYIYKLTLIQNRELIYNNLRLFFNSIGLDFFTFRSVLVFICGLFAIKGLKRLNVSIPIFLFFYMPILLFMDSGQMRNAICLYILVYGLFFLTDEKNFSTLFFILTIILLSQIHTAFIFYLILLVLKIRDEKKRNTILYSTVAVTLIFFIMTILNNHRMPFIDVIYGFILSESDVRASRYITTAGLGFLFPLVVYIIMTLTLRYASLGFIGNALEKKYVEIVNGINVISFIFFPFMMMNITYYRFIRNAYFLSLIAAVILLKQIAINRVRKILLIVSCILVTVLWIFFEIVIYDTPQNIIEPILKNGEWFFNL